MKLATTIMMCSIAKAKTLTVMVGIPGSGKTTKAMQLAARNSNSVLLSRDTLRKEISFADESNLTAYMVQLASTALEAGKDVIVDSPNLDKSDISVWTSLAVQHKAKLNTVHMNTPLGIAVNRDAKRPHPVGLAKIKSMLKAAGTSEGNRKGWDTRGRGRKVADSASKLHDLIKTSRPRDGGIKQYAYQKPLLQELHLQLKDAVIYGSTGTIGDFKRAVNTAGAYLDDADKLAARGDWKQAVTTQEYAIMSLHNAIDVFTFAVDHHKGKK